MGTLNTKTRVKVIFAATDVAASSDDYVEAGEIQESCEKFIDEMLKHNMGTYLSQKTLLSVIETEVDIHQMFRNLSADAEVQPFRRQFIIVVTAGIVAEKSIRPNSFEFRVPTFFVRFVPEFF